MIYSCLFLILIVFQASESACAQNKQCAGTNQFRCLSGQCIDKKLLCDLKNDCTDGSDESDTLCAYRKLSQISSVDINSISSSTVSSSTTSTTASPVSTTTDSPVSTTTDSPVSTTADSPVSTIADAPSSTTTTTTTERTITDEKSNENSNNSSSPSIARSRRESNPASHSSLGSRFGCDINEFACLSGECISRSLTCDGHNDCSDSSDEASSICPNHGGITLSYNHNSNPTPARRPVSPTYGSNYGVSDNSSPNYVNNNYKPDDYSQSNQNVNSNGFYNGNSNTNSLNNPTSNPSTNYNSNSNNNGYNSNYPTSNPSGNYNGNSINNNYNTINPTSNPSTNYNGNSNSNGYNNNNPISNPTSNYNSNSVDNNYNGNSNGNYNSNPNSNLNTNNIKNNNYDSIGSSSSSNNNSNYNNSSGKNNNSSNNNYNNNNNNKGNSYGNSNGKGGAAKLTPCRAPIQPDHGRWRLHRSQCESGRECDAPSLTRTMDPGTYLVYTCNDGYALNGNRDVLCGPGGNWVKEPICEEVKCRFLSDTATEAICMLNGLVVSCEIPSSINTSATLKCRDGFVEEVAFNPGHKNVTCQSDGNWSPDPIHCVRKPKKVTLVLKGDMILEE